MTRETPAKCLEAAADALKNPDSLSPADASGMFTDPDRFLALGLCLAKRAQAPAAKILDGKVVPAKDGVMKRAVVVEVCVEVDMSKDGDQPNKILKTLPAKLDAAVQNLRKDEGTLVEWAKEGWVEPYNVFIGVGFIKGWRFSWSAITQDERIGVAQ